MRILWQWSREKAKDAKHDNALYTCGKRGHSPKDCYQNKGGYGGKGGKGGYAGKGDDQNPKGYGKEGEKGKGKGQGAPKGGCWMRGGSHHESACPKKQGGVNEVGQEHDCNKHAPENAGGFNLGGGEDDQGGWNTINENYSLEDEQIKSYNPRVPEKCIYEVGKHGEWHKIALSL